MSQIGQDAGFTVAADATPTLRTPRLLLRGWRTPDRQPFADLNADPRVMEHFPEPYTRERSDEFVDRILRGWREHGYGLWAVERRDTNRFIGYVGLSAAVFDAPFTPAVEVGWRLATEHWGHGYATEAASAALEFGFRTVGLAEIVSFTALQNARSWRVMQRLGMVRDFRGDFDHPNVPVGHPVRPHVLYRMPRDRWTETQATVETSGRST